MSLCQEHKVQDVRNETRRAGEARGWGDEHRVLKGRRPKERVRLLLEAEIRRFSMGV